MGGFGDFPWLETSHGEAKFTCWLQLWASRHAQAVARCFWGLSCPMGGLTNDVPLFLPSPLTQRVTQLSGPIDVVPSIHHHVMWCGTWHPSQPSRLLPHWDCRPCFHLQAWISEEGRNALWVTTLKSFTLQDVNVGGYCSEVFQFALNPCKFRCRNQNLEFLYLAIWKRFQQNADTCRIFHIIFTIRKQQIQRPSAPSWLKKWTTIYHCMFCSLVGASKL